MVRYFFKRLGYMIITLWVIITLTFLLMHQLPGDPFSDIEKLTPQLQAKLLEKYELDRPLSEQYIKYVGNILHGDLGSSYKSTNQDVNDIIANRFPVSARIGFQAILFGVIVGLALGIIAALRQSSWIDYTAIVIAIIGVSIPNFVMATLMSYYIGVELKWLPTAGWGHGEFQYTIMPSLALSFSMLAYFARMMRTSMLDVTSMDYIKTAKSKGLTDLQITYKHMFRNAILPIVTILGPMVVNVITGTIIIERIFLIPGLGQYYINSIYLNDYTVTLGLTIFYSALLIFSIFVVDILYGIIDPRIRVAGRK